ncbi:MAG: alpha/beta hydrolase [Pseudomonadota bacterium]
MGAARLRSALLRVVVAFAVLPGPVALAREGAPPLVTLTKAGAAEGRTVVLIHGLASNAAVWDATRDALAPDYDLRIAQFAGMAGAPAAEIEGAVLERYTAALISALRAEEGRDIVLVGHSMGGAIALKTALAAPDLVDELVIVDAVPFLAALFFPGVQPAAAAVQGEAMTMGMTAQPRAAFLLQQKAGLRRLLKTEAYRPVVEDWLERSDQRTVARAMGALIATDLRSDLSALSQDILVLAPWDPTIGLLKSQVRLLYEAQYAAARSAKVEIVDGAYHFIMIDQPARFLELLRGALSD